MHILIPVYFNSSMGGLHLNVFSTAKFLIKKNHSVTVICKDGEFSTLLKKNNINVIHTNFETTEKENTIDKVLELHKKKPIDIIHTHPFESRKFALAIHSIIQVPIFITIHGKYTDSLNKYFDSISMVFTVSEGIKNYIIDTTNITQREKFSVFPNGVDTNIFNTRLSFKDKLFSKINKQSNTIICLASRLDKDKQFIIDIYYNALRHTVRNYKNVKWKIIGDGTELEEMKRKTNEITGNDSTVSFLGWKNTKELSKEFKKSDIIFSPGRSALEGMGTGKPVIALGSKKYIGLIKNDNWLEGVYTNFGGVGNKHNDYKEGSVEKDLDYLLKDPNQIVRLGKFGGNLISIYYDEDKINEELLSYYKLFQIAAEI